MQKKKMAKAATEVNDLVEEKIKCSTALRKLKKISEKAKDFGAFSMEEAYER